MGSAWASGGGLDRQQGQCPLSHISLEAHADGEPCLLHHATTGGITWRVLLRPELRRAGESEVVEFQKLGRSGKLLDQVIGWGGGSCAERRAQVLLQILSRQAPAFSSRCNEFHLDAQWGSHRHKLGAEILEA
jgi:hypothetical protein